MFPVHTLTTAPEKSKPALEGLQKTFGLIPNLAATMATSPTLVNGFVGALVNFLGGTLDAKERQVVLLTNAVMNRSAWAVAFHSTAALKEGVSTDDVKAIREGGLPENAKYRALSSTVRALVERRGHLEPRDLELFAAAGYSHAQLLEVIAGQGASMMANYAGNITRPPLETPFAPQAW
ncbi:MAG: carboxymuconolactone decarboxylase family protein [Archangium sp.]